MLTGMDELFELIEARVVFPAHRPATAGFQNLLGDLSVFFGRFILKRIVQRGTGRVSWGHCKENSAMNLTRAFYAWAMWRGRMPDHDLTEAEFSKLRDMQGRGSAAAGPAQGFILFHVKSAREFNKFRRLVGQVATRRSPPVRRRVDVMFWPAQLVLICEFK